MATQAGDSAPVVADGQNPLWRGPLTHFAYAMFVARASLATRDVVRPHVQVKLRGATLCGQVVKLSESTDRGEFFKVETQLGEGWYAAHNVRLCSGDGRCCCDDGLNLGVEALPGALFSQAGVVAPPESLNLGTAGVSR